MRGIGHAYSLLREFEALEDHVLEAIFDRMPAGPKVKTCSVKRFHDLDNLTMKACEATFPAGKSITVHDMAASHALPSASLFRRLSQDRDVALIATDYFDAIHIVRLGGLDFIFDAADEPLQLAIGATGFDARRTPWKQLFWVFWRPARKRLHRASRIDLFHPQARRLADENAGFSLGRSNFFDPPTEKFDIVRLANAIGDVFSHAENHTIFHNALSSINEGGLFVVGNRGNYSVFRKEGRQLPELFRLGDGFAASRYLA